MKYGLSDLQGVGYVGTRRVVRSPFVLNSGIIRPKADIEPEGSEPEQRLQTVGETA